MSQPSDLVINPDYRWRPDDLGNGVDRRREPSDGMVLLRAFRDRNPGPTEASVALTLHRYNGVAKALPPRRPQRATLSRSIN
jgi:hypothetical protein